MCWGLCLRLSVLPVVQRPCLRLSVLPVVQRPCLRLSVLPVIQRPCPKRPTSKLARLSSSADEVPTSTV